jgi:hypothetical protein
MEETLSFNCAQTEIEFSFNLSTKEDGSARAITKKMAHFEHNIMKQLALNYNYFKQEYNIFEKLLHFVVYRLKVNKLVQVIIHTI